MARMIIDFHPGTGEVLNLEVNDGPMRYAHVNFAADGTPSLKPVPAAVTAAAAEAIALVTGEKTRFMREMLVSVGGVGADKIDEALAALDEVKGRR